MGRLIDLTGQRFGNLVVLKRDPNKKVRGSGITFWECECQCFHKTIDSYSSQELRGGLISCGKCGPVREYDPRRKTYDAWKMIKQRCFNPKHKEFKKYGGARPRITMHPAWVDDFESFLAGVGLPPHEKAILARIRQEKGFEPGNICWANPGDQQSLYGKKTIFCEHPETGRGVSAREVQKYLGGDVPMSVVRARLSRRRKALDADKPPRKIWGIEEIFTTPPRPRISNHFYVDKLTVDIPVISE